MKHVWKRGIAGFLVFVMVFSLFFGDAALTGYAVNDTGRTTADQTKEEDPPTANESDRETPSLDTESGGEGEGISENPSEKNPSREESVQTTAAQTEKSSGGNESEESDTKKDEESGGKDESSKPDTEKNSESSGEGIIDQETDPSESTTVAEDDGKEDADDKTSEEDTVSTEATEESDEEDDAEGDEEIIGMYISGFSLERALEPGSERNKVMALAADAEKGSLQELVNEAADGAEETDGWKVFTLKLEDDYPGNLVITDGLDVTIDLNGHTITAYRPGDDQENGTLNTILVYGKLTIRDGGEDKNGKIWAGEGENQAIEVRGITVAREASVTLESGSVEGFRTKTNGAGVWVYNGGAFAMSGGSVRNNQTEQSGGGIFAYDAGGVHINGGEISGNSAEQNGGGIAFHQGTQEGESLELSNVEIRENTAGKNGGGVYGGSYMNRTVKNANIDKNTAQGSGGGIYFGAGSTLIIESGMVSENTAGSNGGGIYASDNSVVQLVGGEISDNKAKKGGGVYQLKNGSLTIKDNAVVRKNTATAYGGGIYTASPVFMEGGTVENNDCPSTEQNGGGGGFYIAEIDRGQPGLTLTGGKITGNTTSRYGGGIWSNWRTTNIQGGEISGNTAGTRGGGYYSNQGKTMISGGVFSGNKASGHGGGVCVWNGGEAEINGGMFTSNTSNQYGGGIAVGSGVLKVTGGEISCNQAKQHGGGIYSENIVNVSDAVVSGNQSNDRGGGICGKKVTLKDATVAENTASYGGGIYGTDEVTILNGTVISENKANYNGGGIAGEKAIVVDGVVITGNTANNGGGIYGKLTVTVESGTLSDNVADNNGGGIYGENEITIIAGVVLSENDTANGYGRELYAINASKVSLCEASEINGGIPDKSVWWNEKDHIVYVPGDSHTGNCMLTFLKDCDAIARIGDDIYSSVQTAIDAAKDGDVIVMIDNSAECVTISKEARITLDLNGYALRANEERKSVIAVLNKNATLVLRDNSKSQTGRIRDGNSSQGGGIYIDGGTVIMESGRIIKNNAYWYDRAGGGVFVGNGGRFEMSGGSIEKNTTQAYMWGSLTYAAGAGICVSGPGSSVLISGDAIISENKSYYPGGGILAEKNAVVTITGGIIKNNSSERTGGGIRVDNAVLNMSGGRIENNAGGGGGISASGNNTKINISGDAVITGNNGGGVTCENGNNSSLEFHFTGGAIYGNKNGGRSSDVNFWRKANVSLLNASEMRDSGNELSYISWYDYTTKTIYADVTALNQNVHYDLYAFQDITVLDVDAVCRIEDKTYSNLKKAISEIKAGSVSENFTIYLLKDVKESAEIPSGKSIAIDLNGWNLSPIKEDYTLKVNGGGKLTVRNTVEDESGNRREDANPKDGGGKIIPAEGMTKSRGIWVEGGNGTRLLMQDVALEDFKGNGAGGGIYTRANTWDIILRNVRIANCSATSSGGGMHVTSGTQKSTLTMQGCIVQNCVASGAGGGIFATFENSVQPNIIKISDCQILNNKASGAAGGLRMLGKDDINNKTKLLMDKTVIRGNSASSGGATDIANAWVEMNDVQVCKNETTGKDTGGLRLWNKLDKKGPYEVEDSQYGQRIYLNQVDIYGNKGRGDGGGGLFIKGWAEIKNSEIHDNEVLTANNGGGLYLTTDSEVTVSGTKIYANKTGDSGGGICINGTAVTATIGDDTEIYGNEANKGGGLFLAANANVTIGGTKIYANKAKDKGGGIYTNSVAAAAVVNRGTEIYDNTANNGGGLYLEQSRTVTVSDGIIRNNCAVNKGGGAYVMGPARFELKENGAVYGNIAGLGQDVYAESKNNNGPLQLMPAREMNCGNNRPTGWLDENTGEVLSRAIQGKLVRDYALTLTYDSGDTVALVMDADEQNGFREYNSVQEAVDFVASAGGDTIPEIRMVANAHENVTVPGSVNAKLNLNGYQLHGYTTAISAYGTLTIVDEPETIAQFTPGPGPGTITGSSITAGGGIHVLSGGHVTLESGRIADCSAAIDSGISTNGGGAVCADGGTFVLAGSGLLENNRSNYGAAVLIRNAASAFRMTGGRIQNNHSGEDGVIYVRGGTAEISGGDVRENTGKMGTIFVNGGRTEITGGKICDNTMSNEGGAIWLAGGKLTINGRNGDKPVLISGNKAAVRGGAIYVYGGTATLEHAQIKGNATTKGISDDVAGSAGGGIYQFSGRLNIGDKAEITGNKAVRGGGIYQKSGTAYQYGGRISGNTAQVGGGGAAQHPTGGASYTLAGGGVFGNWSLQSSMGNDFYSKYEGTGKYDATTGGIPSLTLVSAATMGNRNYNVWRNDAYDEGDGGVYNRYGAYIQDGQYITSRLERVFNAQLTADYFMTETKSILYDNMRVNSIQIAEKDQTLQTATGMPMWDKSAGSEKTAAEMLKEGAAGWKESEKTYMSNTVSGNQLIAYQENEDSEPVYYEREQTAEWVPGDDSGSTNMLVRTFDQMSYPLVVTTETVDGEIKPAAGAVYRVWVEITLPASPEEASFVENGLLGSGNEALKAYTVTTENRDGKTVQILRGYWERSAENNQGGNISGTIAVKIRGMKNGDTIKPEFSSWVQGNADNAEKPARCSSPCMTVSAAPKYNVTLDYNKDMSYTGNFNLDTGEEAAKGVPETEGGNVVYGTMLGYGVTVELYNDVQEKGLKGIEIPADGLEFDLSLKGGLFRNDEPALDAEGNPIRHAPYIWAYKENNRDLYGRGLGSGSGIQYNMDWNDEDDLTKHTYYAYNAAPYNTGNNKSGCYSGGSWMLDGTQPGKEAKETKVHVKVTGYQFDFDNDANPVQTSDGSSSGAAGKILNQGNVKAFTAGYIQVIYPMDEVQDVDQVDYYSISMEAAVTGFDARGISGAEAMAVDTERKDGESDEAYEKRIDKAGLNTLNLYFNKPDASELVRSVEGEEALAVREMNYADNYTYNDFGMYLFPGSGDGEGDGSDSITKTNYFLKADKSALSGSGGQGTTPLQSKVYIGGKVHFNSRIVNTTDPKSAHYIPPEEFNHQTHEMIEYYYMTGLNLLQKFDGVAYRPVGTGEIVNKRYDLKSTANEIGGAFRITTTESAVTWAQQNQPQPTQSYTLTVLYGAKPDGTNWEKEKLPEGKPAQGEKDKEYNNGGVSEMDVYREENLIYFTTMEELQAYFAEKGKEGVCVAILYEFRNCCIRRDREISAEALMQVTNDFNLTGETYCTTNDARAWSTYRPDYKIEYTADKNKMAEKLGIHAFSWKTEGSNAPYGGAAAVGTVYGGAVNGIGDSEVPGVQAGTTAVSQEDPGYLAYIDGDGEQNKGRRWSAESYWNGYVKSQYAYGSKLGGTHNGWYSGNTLLLYTLDTNIQIYGTDTVYASNGRIKNTYDYSAGEREANFRTTPHINIASAVKNHELVANGSQSTEIVIEIELPAGLKYKEGTVRMDYDAKGSDGKKVCGYQEGDLTWNITPPEPGAEGPAVLRLSTFVTDIDKGLPEIHFGTLIQDNPGGTVWSLPVKASIRAVYEEESRLAADAHTDSLSIQVVKSSNDSIYKGVEETLTEIGDDLVYLLNYTNNAGSAENPEVSRQPVDFVDVLPYNGDGRGTAFTGGYRVSKIELKYKEGEGTETSERNVLEQTRLYYLTGQKAPNGAGENTQEALLAKFPQLRNGGDRVSGEGNGSAAYEITGEGVITVPGVSEDGYAVKVYEFDETDVQMNKGLTQTQDMTNGGIALYAYMPGVAAKGDVQIRITLTPWKKAPAKGAGDTVTPGAMITDKNGKTQTGNNVYGNNFFFKTIGSPAQSANVSIRTIGRTISGIVWLDQDKDGRYVKGVSSNLSNDRLMAGVDVYLYQVETDTLAGGNAVLADEALETLEKDQNGKITSAPAFDLIGNPCVAVTDSEGQYRFENLGPGNYIVVFQDDKEPYKVAEKGSSGKVTMSAAPIAFDRLSVTDTNQRNVINLNCSEPYYHVEDTEEGPAALTSAHTYTAVKMLPKEEIQMGQQASANWNLGLYYIDQRIAKKWSNMKADVPTGYGITIKMTGAADQQPYKLEQDFTMKKTGNSQNDVELTVNAAPDTSGTFGAWGQSAKIAVDKAEESKNRYSYTWTLDRVALQAEGSAGPEHPIRYSLAEVSAFDGAGYSLNGFVKTEESAEDKSGSSFAGGTFTAVNTATHGMPRTGGMGAWPFVLFGGLEAAVCAGFLIRRRRRKMAG